MFSCWIEFFFDKGLVAEILIDFLIILSAIFNCNNSRHNLVLELSCTV